MVTIKDVAFKLGMCHLEVTVLSCFFNRFVFIVFLFVFMCVFFFVFWFAFLNINIIDL